MKYIRKGDRTSINSYICSNCGIDFVADPPPTDKSGEIQVDAFPPPLILVPVELSLGFGEIGLLIVLLLALLDVFLDLFLEEAELRLPLDASSTVVTPGEEGLNLPTTSPKSASGESSLRISE
jgi:hypothetical protein